MEQAHQNHQALYPAGTSKVASAGWSHGLTPEAALGSPTDPQVSPRKLRGFQRSHAPQAGAQPGHLPQEASPEPAVRPLVPQTPCVHSQVPDLF